MSDRNAGPIRNLTPEAELRIDRSPLLNIDTFIIPSPYVRDTRIEKDYRRSYVWIVEGEILGYLLVYSDKNEENFHIYKLVTSPFGRGKGIGTAFIERLASDIPERATVYLYIWDKQADTIEFFHNKGFSIGDTIVYRNLIYYHVSATGEEILRYVRPEQDGLQSAVEEIGKTRHDARKTLRLLSHMVDMLSVENCNKIIEDINRETTTLINMLNSFRDSMKIIHEVNLKDLIVERILLFIQASPVRCEVRLYIDSQTPVVLGYYVNIGRALVNLVSNALDAIADSGRKGCLEIGIAEDEDTIVLTLSDNGAGMIPEMLVKNSEGYPAFVGRTTKGHKTGEGLGTRQIYSTFGAGNVDVESTPGIGTTWRIRLLRSCAAQDKTYMRLERRYSEVRDLMENFTITTETERTRVVAFIWQLRRMEILVFDLILQFSSYHNIRTIFRLMLAYLFGNYPEQDLKNDIDDFRCDHEPIREWLFSMLRKIRERMAYLESAVDISTYRGALFKSYGQAVDNTIIFTLDPATGNFLATDRKLAEHLDFVQYLGKPKEKLLRGEFKGDANNDEKPILLGVWSIESPEDLERKLVLLQAGARALLAMGLHKKKRLSFYQTTHVLCRFDIDTYRSSTLEEFASLDSGGLSNFIRHADDELQGMILGQE